MDGLLQDLRYAVRTLAKAPGFTIAAVLAMALGIGGTAAIFAGFDALLLKPLPIPEPDRLVRIHQLRPDGGRNLISPANWFELANGGAHLFESASAFYALRWTMLTQSGPELIRVTAVSASFLKTLKISPVLGRDFLAEEEFDGKETRLILTDGAWRRLFGGDAAIIGRSVMLNTRAFTIVGVLPRNFHFVAMPDTEGVVPIGFDQGDLRNRGSHFMQGMARLKPGVSAERAQRDLQVVARSLEQVDPGNNKGWSAMVQPFASDLTRGSREPLALLISAVGLVLLVACANVASMLLARGAARRRELAIRAAIGGGRWRIARQLLLEGLLLGLAGGVLGVFIAVWGIDGIVALAPPETPRLDEIRLDLRVLAFTGGISLVTGLLAGLAPAIQASAPDLLDALRSAGSASTGGPDKARARAALVIAEVSLALILVVGAGLLGKSLQRVLDTSVGFDARNLVAVSLGFPQQKFKSVAEVTALHDELYRRIAAIPGVEAAALTSHVPLRPETFGNGYIVDGRPAPPPGDMPSADLHWVSPSYFQALRMKVLRGRAFQQSDTLRSPKVLVVNEAFVRTQFPQEEPLGRRVTIQQSFYADKFESWEIVGVVSDVRSQGLDREARPEFYISQEQQGYRFLNVMVRTRLRLADVVRAVRAEVLAIDPEQPVGRAWTAEELVDQSIGSRKLQAILLALFGALSLTLAALGVYGLIAYEVAQRTREFGIRMALGAARGHVLRMVIGDGLRLAGAGVFVGLFGALAAAHAIRGALYGVSASDPSTYAAVGALLALVAVVASYLPARRATKVPPMEALRSE